MKRAIQIVLVVGLGVLLGSAQTHPTSEENDVYAAWLNTAFITPQTEQVFLMEFTRDFWDDLSEVPKHRRRPLYKLQKATLKDYRRRNKTQVQLANSFGVKPAVIILPVDSVNFMRSGAGYEATVRKSKEQFGITFSRVGFNTNRTQAFLHVDYNSTDGSKWAFGRYFILSKKSGTWTVTAYSKSWEY